MEPTVIEHESSTRRRKVTKFALAGVAVLGVGAALTSAAWSDNVFFGGSTSAAEFELQGLDPAGGGWLDADSAGARIILPADALTEVGPGISDSYTVTVRNNGDLPIKLEEPVVVSTTGGLFALPEPASVSFGGYSIDVLEERFDSATIEVIVTGNELWEDAEYQGRTGNLVIQISGSSITPPAP